MTLERPAAMTPARSAARVVREILLRAGVPLGLALAVRGLLGSAVSSLGIDAWTSKPWIHWDAELYLDIARSGYTLEHCRAVWPAHDWCGNAGWMPLYPYLVRWVSGGSERGAAAVAFLACAAMLAILWNCFLRARVTFNNVLALLLAAVFPGHVYQQAAFPTSLTLCLILLALWLCFSRPWAAGVAGGLAATAYPLGVLMAPVLGLGTLLGGEGTWRRRLAMGMVVGTLVLLGVAATALLFHVTVGHANAFLLVQAKYGMDRTNPLFMLLEKIHGIADTGLQKTSMWTGLQTLLILIWIIGLLPRRDVALVDPSDRLILVYTLTMWLVPLTAGTRLDLYRSEALLVPSVLLARRLSPWHQVLFLAAFALLARPMALLYFTGLLE